MSPSTDNMETDGAVLGKNHARNTRKKELAKQKKADTLAKLAEEEKRRGEVLNNHTIAQQASDKVPLLGKDPALLTSDGDTKVETKIALPSIPQGASYEIKAAPGKGLGLFATRRIKQGDEIFREDPVLPGVQSWWSKHAIFTQLSDEKKAQYMALNTGCVCKKEVCEETYLTRVWEMNSFEVSTMPPLPLPDKYGGPFVYLVASRINHDCVPNTMRGFTSECQIVFNANKDIQAGEEITTNYGGMSSAMLEGVTAQDRRKHLLERHGFICTCRTCKAKLPLTLRDALRAFNVIVIRKAGTPVLGKHTAREKQAFAEVDKWYCEWEAHFHTASTQAIQDTSQRLLLTTSDPKVMFRALYKVQMESQWAFILRNDKYGLGLHDSFLLWFILRGKKVEFAQLQVGRIQGAQRAMNFVPLAEYHGQA